MMVLPIWRQYAELARIATLTFFYIFCFSLLSAVLLQQSSHTASTYIHIYKKYLGPGEE